MKKNISLLAILIALLTFTYFFQEVGDLKKKEELKYDNGLFDARLLGDIKEFSTIDSHIVVDKGEYKLKKSGKSADPRKIQGFFNILSGLKIKRVLSEEEVLKKGITTFFTTQGSHLEKMSFVFLKTTLNFYLGRKLEFDQSFYMKIEKGEKTSYVIAYDEKAINVPVAKKEFHRNDLKYRRFQSLFYFSDAYFKDYRFFHPWMGEKWSIKTIKFESKRNPPFAVDLPKVKTSPLWPSFLSIDVDKLKELEKSLVHLEGVKSSQLKLNKKNELSRIEIQTLKDQNCHLSLYKKEKEYFVYSSLLDETFLIRKEERDLFYYQVDSLWDKRFVKHNSKRVTIQFRKNEYALKEGALLKTLQKGADHMVYFDRKKLKPSAFILNNDDKFILQILNSKLYVIHQKTLQSLVYALEDATLVSLNEEFYK